MVSGSGIQNKILQAMAIGTPVVSTSIATFALQASNGKQILIADQPEDFAYAVISLLKDATLRKKISKMPGTMLKNTIIGKRLGFN